MAGCLHTESLCWLSSINILGTPDARGEGAACQPALPDGGCEGGAGQPQQGPGEIGKHMINI